MSTTIELTGVGVSDLQEAAVQEATRIMRRARGDRRAATAELLRMLREWELVTDEELSLLTKLGELGFDAADGRIEAEGAYLKARTLRNELVVRRSSPVALAIASSDVGSYTAGETKDGHVVYKKSSPNWQGTPRRPGQ